MTCSKTARMSFFIPHITVYFLAPTPNRVLQYTYIPQAHTGSTLPKYCRGTCSETPGCVL